MSSDIDSKREQLWYRFQNKESRDNWASSHLSTNLAAQIFSLREARGWTQRELAEMVDMAQSRISLMENPEYERFSLATLKRLASAFDVAFVGRFIAFSDLLEWATCLTPERLAPPEFGCDRLVLEDKVPISAYERPASAAVRSKPERVTATISSSPWANQPGILGALAEDGRQERPKYGATYDGGVFQHGVQGTPRAMRQG